jgi:hypothetical protein
MLNLFRHPICKVYTKQFGRPVGCRNKFGMTANRTVISILRKFIFRTLIFQNDVIANNQAMTSFYYQPKKSGGYNFWPCFSAIAFKRVKSSSFNAGGGKNVPASTGTPISSKNASSPAGITVHSK